MAFPGITVKQAKNFYLETVLRVVTPPIFDSNMRVLYLFEPLKQLPCTQSDLIPELEAFRFLVQNLNLLNFPFNSVAFVVKPHPSESKYKYKDINHLFPELNIRLDLDTSLPDLLSWSNVVAGFNTYALTLALAASRLTVSTIPPKSPYKLTLPHDKIVELRLLSIKYSQ